MSANVLFNLLNELEKRDKMRGLLTIVGILIFMSRINFVLS